MLGCDMMDYTVKIQEFEGPLDLLLHLIKESNIDICDIKIEEVTDQYLNYIHQMEKLNLDIASEYLVLAAELIEMKSQVLLPKQKLENDDDYEEDPRQALIDRLLEYQKYKEVSEELKELCQERKTMLTKESSDLRKYQDGVATYSQMNVEDLMLAFNKFLERQALNRPLNTKITTKEYSVENRCAEIKKLLHHKKRLEFTELFDIMSKDYIVVTFLSILELAKNRTLKIEQENNFNKIFLIGSE